MVYKKSFEVMKKCFFVFKTGLVIFLLEKGGNSEIVTSRSRFFLVNVMERDEGGGGLKREF